MKNLNLKQQAVTTSTLKKGAFLMCMLLPLQQAVADEWSGNVSGFLGQKALDDKDWGQQDQQGAVGIMIDFKKKQWPVSIAIDLVGSGDEDKSSASIKEALASEIQLGVRKIYEPETSSFKPYISGGISFMNVELRNKDRATGLTNLDEDSAVGYWVSAGSYVQISKHFQVGLDVRYSQADVNLSGKERTAGGVQSAVLAGFHW